MYMFLKYIFSEIIILYSQSFDITNYYYIYNKKTDKFS